VRIALAGRELARLSLWDAMTKISVPAFVAVLAFSPLAGGALAAGPGGPQPRAFVSGEGSDVPGCASVITPCRTFQYAHDNIVAPGGSIYVANAANYGQLVITHAISIINDGSGTATILAPSSDGIDIEAGASDVILIKGLTIDGVGMGNNGINLTSAGSLTVTATTVKGFGAGLPNGNGIFIQPGSGALTLDISDTLSTGNARAGILISAAGTAGIRASLTRDQANGNQYGVYLVDAGGSQTVVANQVTASNNTNTGFVAVAGDGSLYLTRCVASGNPTAGVSSSKIVYSAGDNAIYGNTANVTVPGGLTSAPLQ